jgi:hypothetical protein
MASMMADQAVPAPPVKKGYIRGVAAFLPTIMPAIMPTIMIALMTAIMTIL